MIQAAIELVAEKGFAGLVLAEVGARAGYSATLPVHYYKTKETLIMMTAQRILDDYNQLLWERLKGVAGLKAIRIFVRTYLQFAIENPKTRRAYFMITSEAAVDNSLRESVAGLAQTAIKALASRIRDAQDAGEVEPMVDPDVFGALIFAWLRGAVSLWAVDPSIDLERMAVGIEGTIVRALRSSGVTKDGSSEGL
ncbi:TetR/AcrR family transcriptional regulator [Ferrovibrio sp.]|uniref:TetR/AcrR family transcriptional regulator n=1 Tax=Ferrovibrio sp. TaxID=1917215 RepID=UPI003D113C10